VSTGRFGVDVGFIGLREFRRVEAPEVSRPDFTGVTVSQPSLSSVRGWGMELGTAGRGG
jgi:hypothetical protein